MSDPVVSTAENELRPLVERALTSAYELDREIGRGGMGIVYKAKDRRLKRHVAIKLLPPELAFRSEIRTRFLREAETAAQLSHPHIVPIYSVDESEGLVYFVMACVDGDNLGKRIHDRGPMPIDETRRILAEVADALAYAHARGVVHRDIKPDNILLDAADGRSLVTDFGIARAVIEGSDARLTATGMALGTPAYMSPEQSAGDREIDGRSDLYSLGVVAYQMLAGELPFQASSTPAMLVKHLQEIPMPVEQRRPDVPPDLSRIVMRLLEKAPENRVQSAAELEGMLLGTITPPQQSYNTTRPAAAQSASAHNTAPYGGPGYATADYPTAGQFGGYQFGQMPQAGNYPAPASRGDVGGATVEELAKWEAEPVRKFRKKLGWFAIMGSVLLVLSIVGNSDWFPLLGIWAIYIAYRYAKLWSDGFDWHDVLRQPRDRLFVDVVAEQADSVGAIFDKDKRQSLRDRARQQRLSAGPSTRGSSSGGGSASYPTPSRTNSGDFGAQADAVRGALADRAEIERLFGTFPTSDRGQLGDVVGSANRLAAMVQALAGTVAELDRNSAGGALNEIESEITKLEAQANPLDRPASEDRVKRLAYLKRQRRGLKDLSRRRAESMSKLDESRLYLQNMRLDLLRLRTGSGGSYVNMTTIVDRANQLARDVDAALEAAAEVRRI